MAGEEVDWDQLDKNKMFVYGIGMFSGVTTVLYPLSVIKTKQMTLPGIGGGFKGARQTASTIMRTEGVPGFYRGFGTVIFGTIPARAVYLTTLEWTKSEVGKVVGDLGVTGPAAAGLANFAGGALASLATQSVTVPIDVISQKQIVHGDETVVARHQSKRTAGAATAPASASTSAASAVGQGKPAAVAPAASSSGSASAGSAPAAPSGAADAASAAARSSGAASTSGRPVTTAATAAAEGAGGEVASSVVRRIGPVQMIRLIVKEEGLAGLYRGFLPSVATFVPSSAVWWGAYGAYQKMIWSVLSDSSSSSSSSDSSGSAGPGGEGQQTHSTGTVVAVQTTSSVLAGCTSSIVTTPLDLIKTRIQVSYKHDGATPSFMDVARQIVREDGPTGFLRGAVPRMVNASLWGTCMVSVYELLKRVCVKDPVA